MEKALFLTNKIYVDASKREGGVRNCTYEFIDLLKEKFDVVIFPVAYHISLAYRVRVKLGVNVYNDFKPGLYKDALERIIKENGIRFVFLNLSHAITFSPLIKEISQGKIKVILCSHGNETGDYLHDVVRFKEKAGFWKKFFSSYTLGKLLKKEAFYRMSYIDMVLNLSPVEEQIEKWLGAKNTFMVPRTIKKDFLELKPVLNRVGFIGDLSHSPNQSGIFAICEALSQQQHSIEIHLVGGPEYVGEAIAAKYSFVKYKGYLPDDQLRTEAATWSYFLNLVFYYSRGVSTKLAKALSWGVPVISTIPGNRGYEWKEGNMLVAENAVHMATLIIESAGDVDKITSDAVEVKKIIATSPTFAQIMDQLYPQLLKL